MRANTTLTRTTQTKTEYVFTADDLRDALGLPAHAELFVAVPGGGDWSNRDLDLEENPLEARCVETRVTTEELP